MLDNRLERLERLKLLKYDRLSLIYEYEKIETLDELIKEVSADADVLAYIQKEDTDKMTENLYNFVREFMWWLCYSDHNTRPSNLWENDLYGISFYECMVQLYEKLKNK
jgi:hypothetical protein